MSGRGERNGCGQRERRSVPGLTVCSLCSGESLGADDPFEGGQLARVRALEASGAARLTVTECLDECERGDVVVARPSPEGRATQAVPVWFERLAGEELTAALAAWLAAGGPGVVELPVELTPFVIDRVVIDRAAPAPGPEASPPDGIATVVGVATS